MLIKSALDVVGILPKLFLHTQGDFFLLCSLQLLSCVCMCVHMWVRGHLRHTSAECYHLLLLFSILSFEVISSTGLRAHWLGYTGTEASGIHPSPPPKQ